MNKHLLLNKSLFKIISISLVLIYVLIVIFDWDKRSVHWFCVSSVFLFLFLLTYALIIKKYKEWSSSQTILICDNNIAINENKYKPYKEKWWWILVSSVVVVYVFLSMLLYTAWLQNDDYVFSGILSKTTLPADLWAAAAHRYSTWVARFGDFFNVLFPLSDSRWQVWVITPALVVSIPFALHRLFRRDSKECMVSSKGILFFWFCCFLFLLSAATPYWAPFFSYTINANYVWPSIGFIWLFSIYNPTNWNKCGYNSFACWGVFFLAFICGWAAECTAVILVPLLVLLGACSEWKGVKLPPICWSGIVGSVWGAFVLFASPAHIARNAKISATRQLNIDRLTPEQISEFVQNLDWEKVSLLKGASGNISLSGIPLHEHIYFIPYLLDEMWKTASVPFCVAGLLLISLLLSSRYIREIRSAGVSVCICIIACLVAFSYLAACIPTKNSFIPCSFMAATAASLLFFAHTGVNKCSARQLIATLVIAIVGCMTFIPAGVEAWSYLPCRSAYYAKIREQAAAGKENVIIHCPFSIKPKNRLSLIGVLKNDPKAYPNNFAAKYYEVKSIRVLPHQEKK